jgi:ABC-type transport system involved in cytochrome bd biosynthesis fused ATPase/permease subunit
VVSGFSFGFLPQNRKEKNMIYAYSDFEKKIIDAGEKVFKKNIFEMSGMQKKYLVPTVIFIFLACITYVLFIAFDLTCIVILSSILLIISFFPTIFFVHKFEDAKKGIDAARNEYIDVVKTIMEESGLLKVKKFEMFLMEIESELNVESNRLNICVAHVSKMIYIFFVMPLIFVIQKNISGAGSEDILKIFFVWLGIVIVLILVRVLFYDEFINIASQSINKKRIIIEILKDVRYEYFNEFK